jgi:4-amino-4-deoxy-L-arabinose transferase-like glycosyltransferase
VRSSWTAPTIVFAAAAAVRLLHLWELTDSPFATLRMGDGVSYHQWAGRIASGDWLGDGVFYQAPLYPYFLAAIYAALGQSVLVVRICQALVGSVACALLTRAAESEFGRAAGLCTGFLLAFNGEAVFLEGLVQKSVLDSLLVCALILQLLLVRQQPAWPRALALGVVSGLLALSRENALVWLPVIVLWLATRRSQGRACLAGMLAGTILVLAPVAARNRIAGGNWQLTTAQSGPNFYIGNSPVATGTMCRFAAVVRSRPTSSGTPPIWLSKQSAGACRPQRCPTTGPRRRCDGFASIRRRGCA